MNHIPSLLNPEDAESHALKAALASAGRNPWLASILMRRLVTARRRLSDICDGLRAIPRDLRRRLARRWALAMPVAALFLALSSEVTQAASIVVGAEGCTLAGAITAANADSASGGCLAGSGADTLNFELANGTYSYVSPLPDISTDITIQGNGNTTIQRSGGPAFSVLKVTAAGTLTLRNATITGGVAPKEGGGIYSEGTLILDTTTVSGNLAYDGGGIVSRKGPLKLVGSTVSDNRATHYVGGIGVAFNTTEVISSTISGNTSVHTGGISNYRSMLRVIDSTISGNRTSGPNGGIGNHYGTVIIANSTISDNSARLYDGGIGSNTGPVTITHSTITGNSSTEAGGLFSLNGAPFTLIGSIVADQSGGLDCMAAPAAAYFNSGGFNIESGTSCGFTGTGDQQNVTKAQLQLGPLALNLPGNTLTHALGIGSVALDRIPRGTNGCGTTTTTDQRGVSRPQNAGCDVGAFELSEQTAVPGATPTPTGPPIVTPTSTWPPTPTQAPTDPATRFKVFLPIAQSTEAGDPGRSVLSSGVRYSR